MATHISSGIARTRTDEEGRFRIQTTPGRTKCSVGERDRRVEWSQELRIEDSLEEYVAAWLLLLNLLFSLNDLDSPKNSLNTRD